MAQILANLLQPRTPQIPFTGRVLELAALVLTVGEMGLCGSKPFHAQRAGTFPHGARCASRVQRVNMVHWGPRHVVCVARAPTPWWRHRRARIVRSALTPVRRRQIARRVQRGHTRQWLGLLCAPSARQVRCSDGLSSMDRLG